MLRWLLKAIAEFFQDTTKRPSFLIDAEKLLCCKREFLFSTDYPKRVLTEKGEKEVKMIPTTSRTRWTKKNTGLRENKFYDLWNVRMTKFLFLNFYRKQKTVTIQRTVNLESIQAKQAYLDY